MKKLLLIFCMIMMSLPVLTTKVYSFDRNSSFVSSGFPVTTVPPGFPVATSFADPAVPLEQDAAPLMTPQMVEMIRFRSNVVEYAINTMVPEQMRQAAADAYENNMSGNGRITPQGLVRVCAAAGWDARTLNGENMCKEFATILLGSVRRYYEVCGKDKGKSGGKEYCIDVFKGTFIDGIKVGQIQAIGIAKEYALVKNGHLIECAREYRQQYNDDFIKCATMDNAIFYEFQFDSIVHSIDRRVQYDVLRSICEKIFDSKSVNAGFGGTEEYGYSYSAPECKVDKIKCMEINKSLQKFGYSAWYSDEVFRKKCYINFGDDVLLNKNLELKTIPGVNNMIFSKDIQIQGSPDLIDLLERYVRVQLQDIGGLQSFVCNYGLKSYRTGEILNPQDDVLTCFANGQQIDFVFDDLSEFSEHTNRGGNSALRCIEGQGLYDGKRCWGLKRNQCYELDEKLKNIDPDSKGTKWIDELDACLLIDARDVKIRNTVNQATIIIGATAVGCVASYGWGCVLVGVEIAAIGVEIVTDHLIEQWSNEFLKESIACKEYECAQITIARNLARIAAAGDKLLPAARIRIDEEIERLVMLLPEELYDHIFSDSDKDGWEEAIIYFDSKLTFEEKTIKITNTVSFFAQMVSLAGAAAPLLRNAPKMFRNIKLVWRANRGLITRNPRILEENIGVFDLNNRLAREMGDAGFYIDIFRPVSGMYLDPFKHFGEGNLVAKLDDLDPGQLRLLTNNGYQYRQVKHDGIEYIVVDGRHAAERLPKKIVHGRTNNDPEFEKLIDERNLYESDLNRRMDAENQIINQDLSNGRITAQEAERLKSNVKTAAIAEQLKLDEGYIMKVARYFDMEATLVEAEIYREFIFQAFGRRGNEDLLDIALNFEKYRNNDAKLAYFGQRLIDITSEYNCITKGNCDFRLRSILEPDVTWSGRYDLRDIHIAKERNTTLDDFITTFAHEDWHRIDHIVPDLGVLGTQKAQFGFDIYSNNLDVYYYNLTEQSSYAVGNFVGLGFEWKLAQRYGSPTHIIDAANRYDALMFGVVGAAVSIPTTGVVAAAVEDVAE
ncbi:MAG: hypothetical protein FWG80_04770 [Alphaproteobacteria bacterium]|nr:hypothetical protein [Alphaproteobacteria bacterium]